MIRRLVLIAIFVVLPCRALASTVRIAVIDTGIDATTNLKLCRVGHRSFVVSKPNPLQDEVGHGTHVAGIISRVAGDGDYCIVSVKYYAGNGAPDNLFNLVKAVRYATQLGVDFINISSGGVNPDMNESKAVRYALNSHIKVVAAAGNNNQDLDKDCNYFPACYDARIIMVGGLQSVSPNTRAKFSNYGSRVTRWEVGTHVKSILPGGKFGYMSGTSQATAIACGKLVKEQLTH